MGAEFRLVQVPAQNRANFDRFCACHLRYGICPNFKGLLLKCENDTIFVKVDNDEFSLAIANIEKGNLVPNFD